MYICKQDNRPTVGNYPKKHSIYALWTHHAPSCPESSVCVLFHLWIIQVFRLVVQCQVHNPRNRVSLSILKSVILEEIRHFIHCMQSSQRQLQWMTQVALWMTSDSYIHSQVWNPRSHLVTSCMEVRLQQRVDEPSWSFTDLTSGSMFNTSFVILKVFVLPQALQSIV